MSGIARRARLRCPPDPILDTRIRLIFGDGFPQQCPHPCIIEGMRGAIEPLEPVAQYRPRRIVLAGAANHRMLGRQIIRTDQQFLAQFFTAAQARKLDRDITLALRIAHAQTR